MYFILAGSVVYYSEDYQRVPIISFGKGSLFGECELIGSKLRSFTVKAIEKHTEILCLNKVKFCKIFKNK